MNSQEAKLEDIKKRILTIERESIQKNFGSVGYDPDISRTKADMEAVSKIVDLFNKYEEQQ